MFNKRTKKIVSSIIIFVIVLAMLLPMLTYIIP